MKAILSNLNKFQLYSICILFIIALGWLSLILSLFGIFYNVIILLFLFIGGSILACILFLNIHTIKISKGFIMMTTISLLTVFFFSYYSTPTIYSGRDQGALSEAAIRLSQNHRFDFSFDASREFFKIYGPGKALNFPGFYYKDNGQLTTQFYPGYISWLAGFYSLFGPVGMIIANGISFFIFLMAFYLLARKYLPLYLSFGAVLLIITTFIFSWFFKFTLSENLSLMLLWVGISEFMTFLKNEKRIHLFLVFLSIGLLTFVRLEGLAFFAIIILILYAKYKNWKEIFIYIFDRKIILLLFLIFLSYLYFILTNTYTLIVLLKGILKPFLDSTAVQENTGVIAMTGYVFKIFIAYGLLPVTFFGIIGIFFFLMKKDYHKLIPFFITVPTFIYLIYPGISVDHPWMLRRYIFSVIPTCILLAVVFLNAYFKKRIYLYLMIAIILLSNWSVTQAYFKFIPDVNLLSQINRISSNFKDTDLILVDKNATGDGWSMMTGPMSFMFGKQSVYFFNPSDLEKIDIGKFSDVYFIIPDSGIDFYQKSDMMKKLIIERDYSISNLAMNIPEMTKSQAVDSKIMLPPIREITIQGKIYLLKK